MDPNNELGNIQPLDQPLGQPMDQPQPQPQPQLQFQPTEEPQLPPMQPLPLTSEQLAQQAEQPVQQPVQPMGQPMPPMGQPMQPMNQPIQPVQPQKPKINFLLIGIIAGAAILLAVVAVVVIMSNTGGKKSTPANPSPEPVSEEVVPTPELARATCKKYNGKLEAFEEDEVDSSHADLESFYTCKYFKNAQQTDAGNYVSTYVTGDFEYQVDFIKESKLSEYRTKAKEAFESVTDVNLKVLKGNDGLLGYYGSILVGDQDGQGLRAYTYNLLYDNVALSLMVYDQNDVLAKSILEELGFPDPDKIIINNTGSNDPAAQARDATRVDDYSMIVTAVNSYMASHEGQINNMIKDADPHTLTASKWINESGNDPDGKPYDLKAYSWETWNNAPVAPYNSDGSQVFIIINANCKGTDANGNSTPARDRAARSFAVYGYLESGRFCQASGSAE